ncbi:AMP-binding protein [Ilumatobacter sp.]|uniref:AMP-binding protein n=1 Tax=Ilumatobacter sp. TaxID=1967498 RepID=UPI003B51C7F3
MSSNLFHALVPSDATQRRRPLLRRPGGQTLSYGDVDDRSASVAGALVDAGVEVGDRVVVQVDKSTDAVALYLACLRRGAVFLPLNTAYTPAEVGFFVEDASPALVVTRPGSRTDLGPDVAVVELGVDGGGSFAEAIDAAQPIHDVVERADDDLAAMLYTSGTTGRSKGAMLTHANLRSNGEALREVWGFVADDVLLHTLPIFHVHGLFVALHCAMLARAEVIFLDRFDVGAVVEHLPGSTVMMGVPTHYARLLDHDAFSAATCSTVRLLTSGSAPMTAATHRRVAERIGHEIVERYGMTEAGIITSNPDDGERVPGTVGFALPGVELRVADDDGVVVPTGETGVVEIRSPGLFAGYWDLPDKTAAEHREGGWFVTGDVGSVDAEGRLTLEGRSGDMIISGGLNVYPKEVEMVLDAVAGVDESAVVGVDHPDLGEAVLAIVVADGTVAASDLEDAMAASLDGVLARFKHPRAYVVVDELPRNAMSKVRKSELRTRHAAHFSTR